MDEQKETLDVLKKMLSNQEAALELQKKQLAIAEEQIERSKKQIEESLTLQKEAVSRQGTIFKFAFPVVIFLIIMVLWIYFTKLM